MKSPFLFGLAAVLATASLAFAGGGGDGDKNKEKLNKLSKARKAATVKAAPGEGFTITSGDDFSLNVSNRVQVLWSFSKFTNNDPQNARDTNNFSLRRVRTKFKGNIYSKEMTYKFQVDWTLANPILDAYFDWELWSQEEDHHAIAIRVGAQKPGFGREFTGSSAKLEHTSRSLASRTFAGNRVIGAFVHGTHMEGDKLHWDIGVANGDTAKASTAVESGQNASNQDNELDFYFGARFDPFGDMGDEGYSQGDLEGLDELKASLGFGFFAGNHQVTPAGPDVDAYALNINAAAKYFGVHGLAEFFYRKDDVVGGPSAESSGWNVQASYTLAPLEEGGSQWSIALRGGQTVNLMPQFAGGLSGSPLLLTEGDVTEIGFTLNNYYKKHKLKTQAGWRYQKADPEFGSAFERNFFDIMFQWIF